MKNDIKVSKEFNRIWRNVEKIKINPDIKKTIGNFCNDKIHKNSKKLPKTINTYRWL